MAKTSVSLSLNGDRQTLAAANAARARGDWSAAATYYDRYLRARPNHFAIWVQLGHALKEAGQRVESLIAYSRALALDDTDADLLLSLGHLHKLMGHRDLAIHYYRRSAEADSNVHALNELRALGLANEVAAAPALSDVQPWLTQAGLPRTLARLRALTRSKSRKLLSLANQSRDRRDWPMAARQYRQYLTFRPDHFAIWVQLGHALKEAGQLHEALNAYQIALNIDNEDADLLLNMGHLHKTLGDHENAELLYRRSFDRDGNFAAQNELSRLIIKKSDAEHLPKEISVEPSIVDYGHWLSLHDTTAAQLELQRRISMNMSDPPLISLIVPVYKVAPDIMKDLISSVQRQSYPFWQLCFTLAYFDDPALQKVLVDAASLDDRINLKILDRNGGISFNSNSALEMVRGDFIGLLDHDDLITPNALYECASAILQYPDVDLFYSDKDMIDELGQTRHSPLLKPGWSPDIMLNANYLTHFNIMRRSRVLEIGGWDTSVDGAQDWDLFLKVVGTTDRVHHIPKVLYNWRTLPSSVASGGISIKPYAADAQLKSVRRFLINEGWLGANPTFASLDHIKVEWNKSFQPNITLILLGEDQEGVDWSAAASVSIRKIGVSNHNNVHEINKIISSYSSDVIVICPSNLSPISENWICELVGPLESSRIGVTTGKLLGNRSNILDCGWIVSEGLLKPIFRGLDRYQYSYIGSSGWYRNLSAVSFAGMAFRKSDWHEIGGFKDVERPDLYFSQEIREKKQSRILYNPFAEAWIPSGELSCFSKGLGGRFTKPLTGKDVEYFSPNLKIQPSGAIEFYLKPSPSNDRAHDYESEAGYCAGEYDYTLSNISDSMRAAAAFVPHAQAKRVAWILPDFNMPFYGGILTILRVADYMWRNDKVKPVFIGLGSPSSSDLRKAIARAFPSLAENADIFALDASVDINSLGIGNLDAAICTLWTTAYKLLRLEGVAKKFYFVQDYEPLFYPAGTTSALVEATYRFGFFGICNTEPLAALYREHGGDADHFLPAVDPKVFHKLGRTDKAKDRPVSVFCYARPGHPRNCFHTVIAGLASAKAIMGDKLQIFTAGADWSPRQYGLDGAVEHLGLLTYEQTGDLYRACDMGVVAMATRHPSYLPFELMACGSVVLTNRSKYTDWLLKHEDNSILFELSRSEISQAIVRVANDDELRWKISRQAIADISASYSDWDATCRRVRDLIISGREFM